MGNRYSFKQSFEDWCVANNREDILRLWDYDKNDTLPSEVPSGTKKKYYFLCPSGIHDSETKKICAITENPNRKLICKECNGGFYGGEPKKDYTGKQFGELTVLCLDEEKTKASKYQYWLCECSCGNICSVSSAKLKSEKKTTCGGQYRHKAPQWREPDGWLDSYDPQYLRGLRTSPLYYEYRKSVQEKDNRSCIVCGSQNNIEVHHIYPFALYPHDRFNPNTGVCMCKEHHSIGSPISFHSIYGLHNNTPEQLEEYVNIMRERLGIDEPFDVYQYMENIESDNMGIDDAMFLDLYE